MMEAAAADGIDLLGESHGGFIFPKFMPSFDGMLSACKLIELLSKEKVRLSDVASEVPHSHMSKVEIPCSSEQKGMIMRKMLDTVKDSDRIQTIDGVKFWHGDDWALVLPDAVRPVLYLYAEAETERKSRSIMDKYVKILSKIREG
jgi:phosphomannomutase